jgi:hypothetical protein
MFAMFLLPGFARMIVYYFTSPCVKRSVVYGRKVGATQQFVYWRGTACCWYTHNYVSSNSAGPPQLADGAV